MDSATVMIGAYGMPIDEMQAMLRPWRFRTLREPRWEMTDFGRCKYNKARTLRAKARHKRKKK